MTVFVSIKQNKNSDILSQWKEISSFIVSSFQKAEFNKGYNLKIVHAEIFKNISSKGQNLHITAHNDEQEIIGAIFTIPSSNKMKIEACDIGWFVTSACLSPRYKLVVCDMMINNLYQMLIEAGFKKVITEMGTKNGEKLFSKRYGYTRIEANKNNWVKHLYPLGDG